MHSTMERCSPAEVGLCPDRLQRVAQHIDQRYIVPGRIAGALTLVARRGRIAYLNCQGMADVERKKPVQEDTLFRIYSMTKPITSVGLMMLYEAGHFQLADPVHRYIPEFRKLRVYASGVYPRFITTPTARPMRIIDLLTHTSGLTYGFMKRTNVDAAYRELKLDGDAPAGFTTRRLVQQLAQLALEFSPGEAWNYSVSTDVLGYLIEFFSGRSLADYFQQRIFAPLRMNDTGFHVSAENQQRFAACYEYSRPGSFRLQDDPATSKYLSAPTYFSGGGGLVSSVADYLRFAQMFLNGGELDGARLLGPRTVAFMSRNHLPGGKDLPALTTGSFSEVPFEGVGFGLGVAVRNNSVSSGVLSSAGELSWGGLASTHFWIDPRADLIAIFLTQLIPSSAYNIRNELRTLVYSALVD